MNSRLARSLFSLFVVLAASAFSFGGTVNISSPGTSDTSPFHVMASASSSTSVTSMKIYLDGTSVYSKSSASSIDTSVTASSGSHKLTVKAWDTSGTSFSASKTVSVTAASGTAPAGATTFSKIEEMTGWDSCTGCAGGGGNATFSMTQKQASPSLDGSSTKFSISGSTPFSHGLWWRRMSSNTSATHFVFDMSYYMTNPGASQGLEFAANQGLSSGWYKFSTQCTFGSNAWRVWDSKNGGWVSTGIACTRPAANTWQHVVFEYARSGGKAVFVSITVNGAKHYVNKSFFPQATTSDGSVGIHFQLNGNTTETDYTVYADRMQLKYW